MDPLEAHLGVDYEPWICRLPASLEQCAVCGYRTVRTFYFWPNGPTPTEAICHACGYEYGGNTFVERTTFEMHRAKWQSEGCRWWYSFGKRRQPNDWDVQKNLARLAQEVERAPHVPFLKRAPKLLEYYVKCIDETLPTVDLGKEQALLTRARELLANVPIIGGGSNRTAYRFGAHDVAHEFLLLQPNRGKVVPRPPIQLNLSTTGDPIAVTNVNDKRYTDITSERFRDP
jgi:hypothetical protein